MVRVSTFGRSRLGAQTRQASQMKGHTRGRRPTAHHHQAARPSQEDGLNVLPDDSSRLIIGRTGNRPAILTLRGECTS